MNEQNILVVLVRTGKLTIAQMLDLKTRSHNPEVWQEIARQVEIARILVATMFDMGNKAEREFDFFSMTTTQIMEMGHRAHLLDFCAPIVEGVDFTQMSTQELIDLRNDKNNHPELLEQMD